jgi:FADH2 O2-dependent halogenase
VQGAYDIAIIGSGFAGSLVAMIARKLGRSVVLLEKSKHPRFAIGESSTPLANLILDVLADRYDLPSVRTLVKWGAWQDAHPKIGCGLKRGFTFFHHQFGEVFNDDDTRSHQLLVAASPNDRVADTHWYRSDFDAFFVSEAQRLGATYLDEVDLWGVEASGKRPVIQGRHRGQRLEIHCGLVLDASGPRGFLHRALELPELPLKHLPPTQALYSHFQGVKPWTQTHDAMANAPYPPDDAAVHHVFAGGWIWVLRFNNGVTSAGVAATTRLSNELKFAEGEPAWQRLLERLPSVRAQFAEASATVPFIHSKQLSFLSGDAAGPNWALLPSAAGFIDPLLSTGFPLTLLGIERLARILETKWQHNDFSSALLQYSMQTTMELATTESLIGALYANMHDFELFSALTLLYFAAASFTETARRLGKPELAGESFLLGEHPHFGPLFRQCVNIAQMKPTGTVRAALLHNIHKAIEPVNVAGLGRADRRNWYPALPADLLASAPKLNVARADVEEMLRRCGM